jgi:hypothetical protein
MTTLEGSKICKDRTFAYFGKGYKSGMGDSGTIPAIPIHSTLPGLGVDPGDIASGIQATLRRKPAREPSTN